MNDMESRILERKAQMMVKGGEEPPVDDCKCEFLHIGEDSNSMAINTILTAGDKVDHDTIPPIVHG